MADSSASWVDADPALTWDDLHIPWDGYPPAAPEPEPPAPEPEPVRAPSRVQLEAMLAGATARGDIIEADAIRYELSGRTWQGVNPYAGDDDAEPEGSADPGPAPSGPDPWAGVPPPAEPWNPDADR